jgi:hypothetical protein
MKNSPGALAFHRDMMLDIRLSIVDLITLITVRNSRQAIVDDSLRNADSITIIVSVNKSYSKSMLPTESTLATLALTMFSLSTSTELSQFDSMLPAPSNASGQRPTTQAVSILIPMTPFSVKGEWRNTRDSNLSITGL